jgi:hypothetical protein
MLVYVDYMMLLQLLPLLKQTAVRTALIVQDCSHITLLCVVLSVYSLCAEPSHMYPKKPLPYRSAFSVYIQV